MGLIKGIHHVCVKCNTPEKYEETLSFYRDLLGLTVAKQWAVGVKLDTGAGCVELFNNVEDELPQGVIRHFAFATDHVDELAKLIEDAGYPITVTPHDVELPTEPPTPIRIAFCEGPMGEEIELFQEY